MRNAIVAMISIASVGCAHWYSEDQSTMKIDVLYDEPMALRSCERVAPIEGISYWDRPLAILDLKRKAHTRSATHVVIQETDFGFWRQIYRGLAYRCDSTGPDT
jgi:hypothetical protein